MRKKQEKSLKNTFKEINIDKLLEESEKELDDDNTKYLSQEEVFSN